jgi:hypothetical protein
MAHFAELDATNTVVDVLVVHNDIMFIDGVEDEQRGIDFLNDLFPESGTWVQTSYNHNFRGRYAGVGYTYDADNDWFISPRPFPSWVLNTNVWEPPVARIPHYRWDESTLSWLPPPQPYPSWTWTNEEWTPPFPWPDDGGTYDWDEDTASWVRWEDE